MTEGLITSLFKQGTTPKQTELQSQERGREREQDAQNTES